MARNGDERNEVVLERMEAKLDRLGERMERELGGLGERIERLDRGLGGLGERVALVDRKLDLTRAELRARIEALRLELLDDIQTALKLELGGRRILAEAEIDRLRAEIEAISRRLEAVERER